MQFCVTILFFIFLLGLIRCFTRPDNTHNVPLFEFTNNPFDKSLLCSTPTCCPIALTFDDGPDAPGRATDAIINYLHTNKIPGTFFINTMNWVDVNTNLGAQNSLRNIVDFGFDVGTHTVHHPNLESISNADIHEEIVRVQTTLNTFLRSTPRLSLFRAPYGSPYNAGPQVAMDRVSKIAADAGYLHVGWQIESFDYACGNNVTCVLEPILRAIDDGAWGIVLLHFVYQNTANALPSLIVELRKKNCELFTVEQFVQAKYGRSSARVMDDFNERSKSIITRFRRLR